MTWRRVGVVVVVLALAVVVLALVAVVALASVVAPVASGSFAPRAAWRAGA